MTTSFRDVTELSAIFFERLNHILMTWSVQAIKDVFKYRKDLHLLREDDLGLWCNYVSCSIVTHLCNLGFFPLHMFTWRNNSEGTYI